MSSDDTRTLPVRKEPPAFRRVQIESIDWLTPRMRRVIVGGSELEGLRIEEPAASIRLLLPVRDAELVMPTWTGNQFELPDGDRAPIRTFTPRHLDTENLQLTIDVVRHEVGAASDWVRRAKVGDEVAVSGPGRGYEIDTRASAYLLAGDETAIPAMSQLLETLPTDKPCEVHVEISSADARLELPPHPSAAITWYELGPDQQPGDTLVAAVEAMADVPDVVWAAGEAAGVQRLRKHLFDVRGMTRSAATVRGYWKKGRSAT